MSEIVGGRKTRDAFLLLYLDYKQGRVNLNNIIEEVHPKILQKNQRLNIWWEGNTGPIESLKRNEFIEQKDNYINLTEEGNYKVAELKESFSGRTGKVFFKELWVMALPGRPPRRLFDEKFLYQLEEYVRGENIHTRYGREAASKKLNNHNTFYGAVKGN